METVTHGDAFADLARYYDSIMSHVDYDRWLLAVGAISDLLPRRFRHLDAACGTGTLLRELQRMGWRSAGIDRSASMLKHARKKGVAGPLVCADLCHLPITESFDYVTCLFDSINFLIRKKAMQRALCNLAATLRKDGLLYFDVVTERMVLDHFAGQSWEEKNGSFSTRWDCTYHRATATAETRIRIKRGPSVTLYERVYEQEEIERAVAKAGLQVLAVYDAERWRAVRKRTARIDYICVKGEAGKYAQPFKKIAKRMRRCLGSD